MVHRIQIKPLNVITYDTKILVKVNFTCIQPPPPISRPLPLEMVNVSRN